MEAFWFILILGIALIVVSIIADKYFDSEFKKFKENVLKIHHDAWKSASACGFRTGGIYVLEHFLKRGEFAPEYVVEFLNKLQSLTDEQIENYIDFGSFDETDNNKEESC